MPKSPAFNRGWEHGEQPIVNVSFDEAQTFCNLVGGRLPKLNEWEFAAKFSRVGGSEPLPPQPVRDSVNTADLEKYDKLPHGRCSVCGAPVDVQPDPKKDPNSRFDANDLQMYHMFGNVAEWIDPGKDKPSEVLGGSFADHYNLKEFMIPREVDSRGGNTIGFRCVIVP
jgi:formylglycine-generating enzyme required for sulfatase activity